MNQCGLPVILSFTLESNGNLPNGQSLSSAIQTIDAATEGSVSYYGINCAHPTHCESLFTSDDVFLKRIRAVRGNASKKTHCELDSAQVIDKGNPKEFGEDCSRLLKRAEHLNVWGGCCGTDHRHVAEIVAQLKES